MSGAELGGEWDSRAPFVAVSVIVPGIPSVQTLAPEGEHDTRGSAALKSRQVIQNKGAYTV